ADSARPPALPGDDRDRSLVCPPRCRTGFINAFQPGRHIPQGLKPACLLALAARLKPCPSQNTFMRPTLRPSFYGALPPDRARPAVPATFILAEHPIYSATVLR